ncbi:histidine kinase N-terminal 7TM domain-containing protein [Halomicroarcula sp. GCM10025709]|uniref:histidine kinase N-terminal 7TM domain-containing protein n=1 Tax=Halomicroarcula sp. GCM10025709 TaxID=3252669 RepID=UPI00361E9286
MSVLPAVLLVGYLWRIRERPGIRWFIISIGATGGWGIAAGVERIADGRLLTLAGDHVVVFLSTVAVVTWFLFAVEFVHQRRVPWPTFGALMVVPFVIQVALWSDLGHNLVYAPGTTVSDSGLLQPVAGPCTP